MATRIKRHESKQRTLERKLENAKKKAIKTAVEHMRKFPDGYDPEVLAALAGDSIGSQGNSIDVVPSGVEEIEEAEWRLHASASTLYKIDSILARLKSYPDERRLLPTRLGNVLRAAEDNIDLDEGENIEGS